MVDHMTKVPDADRGMEAALSYLEHIWPRTFSVLKAHDPNSNNALFDIAANIKQSPELQKSIDEMSNGYKEALVKKARVKMDAMVVERERPGLVKRWFSKDARCKAEEVDKARAPLEKEFSDHQWGLWNVNIANYEKLTQQVEASYDEATRAKLGDKVHERAKCDAYVILGKMIQFTVEVFNDSFVRYGIEETGVPKNIEDPRPGRGVK